jgi:hypothetical protein
MSARCRHGNVPAFCTTCSHPKPSSPPERHQTALRLEKWMQRVESQLRWRADIHGIDHARDVDQWFPICGEQAPLILASSAIPTNRCTACLSTIRQRAAGLLDLGRAQSNLQDRLAEKSELAKFGYNVSRLDREERWRILKLAVRDLGLYQVRHAIEGNIELRLAQEDGERRFEYAISEWRFDLDRLRQEPS